jgi:hypothetical protein
VWVGLEEWIVGDDAIQLRPGWRLRGATVGGQAASIRPSTAAEESLADRSVPDPGGFRPQAELIGTVVWSHGQTMVVRAGDLQLVVTNTDHVRRKVSSRIRADLSLWVRAPYEALVSKHPDLDRDWIVDRILVEDRPDPSRPPPPGTATSVIEIDHLPADVPRPVGQNRFYLLDIRPAAD